MKKIFAYALLALSAVGWGGIAALPLLNISMSAAAAWTTALLVGGEICFFSGITLLGSEAWQKIKSAFKKK